MKYQAVAVALLVALLASGVTGCARPAADDATPGGFEIAVSSASIGAAGELPIEVAADKGPNDPPGDNQSPQLSWDAVDGAAYYAVCMFDEDANWLHWLVLDLEKTELAQGEYTAHSNYVGPYPPKNSGRHHYRIEVFALHEAPDHVALRIDAKQAYSEIVRSLDQSGNGEQNTIARGHIIGHYEN
ncbi:MAG: hypothetical protein FWE59_02330 [Oscillospiraceae bacterium]|nr:hypothetical protein [Oscillospiraceae bacterium]